MVRSQRKVSRSRRKVSRSRGKVSRSRRQSKAYRRKRAMSKQARRSRKRTRKRQSLRSKRLSGGMMGEENPGPDVPEVTPSPDGPFDAEVYVGTFSGPYRRWRKAMVEFTIPSQHIRRGILSLRYPDGETGEDIALYPPVGGAQGFRFRQLKEDPPVGWVGYTIKGPTTGMVIRQEKKISFKFNQNNAASQFRKSIERVLRLQVQRDPA